MTTRTGLARGDIVLVVFPFTDLTSSTLRPALVIGRVRGADLILAFITSRTVPGDPQAEHVLTPADTEFAMTGLKVPSILRLDRPVTLHRRLVRRRLGSIGPQTTRAVADALRYVLEL